MLTIVFAALVVALTTNAVLVRRLRRFNKLFDRLKGNTDEEVLTYLELSASDSPMAKKLLDAASTIDVQKAQQLVELYECMVKDVKMRNKQDFLLVWRR
jgi:hypothetical protein